MHEGMDRWLIEYINLLMDEESGYDIIYKFFAIPMFLSFNMRVKITTGIKAIANENMWNCDGFEVFGCASSTTNLSLFAELCLQGICDQFPPFQHDPLYLLLDVFFPWELIIIPVYIHIWQLQVHISCLCPDNSVYRISEAISEHRI